MRLQEKVIIVTGSTTGIGAAIARCCIANGARVLIHGRDESRAKALAEELGPAASHVIADMANPAAPQVIVTAAVRAFGKINGLVNNAALNLRSELATTDAETFDLTMAVNARGPLLLTKTAMPYLLRTQGSVVGIGSISAYTGQYNQLVYAMSKGAHATMSRNLADAYAARRVRFNHLNVGWVLTENEYTLKQAEGLGPDWPAEVAGDRNVPSGRMTQPDEIAHHVVFWLSDWSRPVSGSVVELEQYPIIGRIPAKQGNKPSDLRPRVETEEPLLTNRKPANAGDQNGKHT